MMKVLFATLLIALAVCIMALFLPWWTGSIAAFAIVLILGLSPGKAFIAGLIGAGLAWGIMAGWIDIRNTGILSARIGQVFGGIPGFVLILITIAIGGLTAAAGALTGAMVRMNISGVPSKERP